MKPFILGHLHEINKLHAILDIGVGDGKDALDLVNQGFIVEAVDKSSSYIFSLQKLKEKEKLDNLTITCEDIIHFPFHRPYGAIFAFYILHFFSKDQRSKLINTMQRAT